MALTLEDLEFQTDMISVTKTFHKRTKASVPRIRIHDDRVMIGASQKKPIKIKGLHMIFFYYFLQ